MNKDLSKFTNAELLAEIEARKRLSLEDVEKQRLAVKAEHCKGLTLYAVELIQTSAGIAYALTKTAKQAQELVWQSGADFYDLIDGRSVNHNQKFGKTTPVKDFNSIRDMDYGLFWDMKDGLRIRDYLKIMEINK